jgi:enoyl-CoA hydratase
VGSAASCSIVSQSNVATENTILAWPETELGFFPDAGATWKLSRLPCHIGTYLALTGCRIEGQNAVFDFHHPQKTNNTLKDLKENFTIKI